MKNILVRNCVFEYPEYPGLFGFEITLSGHPDGERHITCPPGFPLRAPNSVEALAMLRGLVEGEQRRLTDLGIPAQEHPRLISASILSSQLN